MPILLEWDRYFAPKALYTLQQIGLHPRVLHKETVVNVSGQPQRFERGSILIPVINRDQNAGVDKALLNATLSTLAANEHVVLHAIDSGLAISGIDLGSPSASVLAKPVIALITGSGTSAYNTGEVWHLLSERYRIPNLTAGY